MKRQLNLEPLPYHVELRDYLKSAEPELWNWFESTQARTDYTDKLRLDLLKVAYRLDADSYPELFLSLDEAKSKLHLDIPVTLYQDQNNRELNASLLYIPGQAHIVFSGPLLTLLNTSELKSVLAHELAHYHLWSSQNEEFYITECLIRAAAQDPRSATSHEQSARLFQLYTEIYADRGAYCVTEDIHPVVSGLVKSQTGLSQVSAISYLQQAEEIFAKETVATEGISHPETFIRTRALSLWQQNSDTVDFQIAAMIEGTSKLDSLDLLSQRRWSAATRRVLEYLLQPKWFQTPATVAHAKIFFEDIQPGAKNTVDVASIRDEWATADSKLREYFCYLLLDFVRVDPELDDMPLAASLELSKRMEMDTVFEKLVAKELKLKIRDVRRLKEQAEEMLAKAESIHE